uniref:ORF39 n=1 Tax=Nitrosopumilaceae spindle-shaped virus TaxID=3065433 RepID=A0AAT9J9U4_9VIRU
MVLAQDKAQRYESERIIEYQEAKAQYEKDLALYEQQQAELERLKAEEEVEAKKIQEQKAKAEAEAKAKAEAELKIEEAWLSQKRSELIQRNLRAGKGSPEMYKSVENSINQLRQQNEEAQAKLASALTQSEYKQIAWQYKETMYGKEAFEKTASTEAKQAFQEYKRFESAYQAAGGGRWDNTILGRAEYIYFGGSSDEYSKIVEADRRNIEASRRMSAGLRASGNAQIKAAQVTELQRLGGTGSLESGAGIGATMVSQTLTIGTNVADRVTVAQGTAAKAQDFGIGFTTETAMFGYQTTGEAEKLRQMQIADYNRTQTNIAVLKDLGINIDVEALNKSGVMSAYNMVELQKPTPIPKPIPSQRISSNIGTGTTTDPFKAQQPNKSMVSPLLSGEAISQISPTKEGSFYPPKPMFTVTTPDGKERSFKTYESAQKFAARYDQPVQTVAGSLSYIFRPEPKTTPTQEAQIGVSKFLDEAAKFKTGNVVLDQIIDPLKFPIGVTRSVVEGLSTLDNLGKQTVAPLVDQALGRKPTQYTVTPVRQTGDAIIFPYSFEDNRFKSWGEVSAQSQQYIREYGGGTFAGEVVSLVVPTGKSIYDIGRRIGTGIAPKLIPKITPTLAAAAISEAKITPKVAAAVKTEVAAKPQGLVRYSRANEIDLPKGFEPAAVSVTPKPSDYGTLSQRLVKAPITDTVIAPNYGVVSKATVTAINEASQSPVLFRLKGITSVSKAPEPPNLNILQEIKTAQRLQRESDIAKQIKLASEKPQPQPKNISRANEIYAETDRDIINTVGLRSQEIPDAARGVSRANILDLKKIGQEILDKKRYKKFQVDELVVNDVQPTGNFPYRDVVPRTAIKYKDVPFVERVSTVKGTSPTPVSFKSPRVDPTYEKIMTGGQSPRYSPMSFTKTAVNVKSPRVNPTYERLTASSGQPYTASAFRTAEKTTSISLGGTVGRIATNQYAIGLKAFKDFQSLIRQPPDFVPSAPRKGVFRPDTSVNVGRGVSTVYTSKAEIGLNAFRRFQDTISENVITPRKGVFRPDTSIKLGTGTGEVVPESSRRIETGMKAFKEFQERVENPKFGLPTSSKSPLSFTRPTTAPKPRDFNKPRDFKKPREFTESDEGGLREVEGKGGTLLQVVKEESPFKSTQISLGKGKGEIIIKKKSALSDPEPSKDPLISTGGLSGTSQPTAAETVSSTTIIPTFPKRETVKPREITLQQPQTKVEVKAENILQTKSEIISKTQTIISPKLTTVVSPKLTTKISPKLSTKISPKLVTEVTPKLETKQTPKLGTRQQLKTPTPQRPKLRSRPMFKFQAKAKTKLDNPPIVPTRRRVVGGLPSPDNGKKKKGKKKSDTGIEFLGSSKLDSIVGLFRREAVIFGDKQVSKQVKRDTKVKVKI